MTGPPPPRDPEELLAQALRAMAGGGRQAPPQRTAEARAGAPFSVLQIVLLAVFLGLLIGMTAGVISLLS